MNEDRIKRGLANSKFLTAVAISALFLSSGNAMAAQTNTDSSLEVTEQLQVQTVSGLVVDASGHRSQCRRERNYKWRYNQY